MGLTIDGVPAVAVRCPSDGRRVALVSPAVAEFEARPPGMSLRRVTLNTALPWITIGDVPVADGADAVAAAIATGALAPVCPHCGALFALEATLQAGRSAYQSGRSAIMLRQSAIVSAPAVTVTDNQ